MPPPGPGRIPRRPPQVLFLDEPTAGLDPASRHDLWALIRDLVDGGTTVLLTTQYLEEGDQLADRIAAIDHGRLLSQGTAPQLKDRVGGALVELRVPAADRAQTLAVLRNGNGEDPTVDEHDGRVVLPAPDGARTLTVALRRLEAAGITPQDAALRKPTLDEVFLTLTGHQATVGNGNTHDRPVAAGRRGRARHAEPAR